MSYPEINGPMSEVLDNSLEEFQDVMEEISTRKFIWSLLRPLLKKSIEEGRDKIPANDPSDCNIWLLGWSETETETNDCDVENFEQKRHDSQFPSLIGMVKANECQLTMDMNTWMMHRQLRTTGWQTQTVSEIFYELTVTRARLAIPEVKV